MGKALLIGVGNANQSFVGVLHQAGYETTSIQQENFCRSGVDPLLGKSPDLVLVAEENLVADGSGKLPVLRHRTSAPIIVIGGGQEQRVVDALMQGADAYLDCTASAEMLLAQLNALMRRHPQPSTTR